MLEEIFCLKPQKQTMLLYLRFESRQFASAIITEQILPLKEAVHYGV